MKKLKAVLLIIIISALFFNCLKDNKSGGYKETNENNREVDSETTSESLNIVMAGPYTFNMILLNTAPYEYKIKMKDPSSDKIIAETRASLGSRPLPYYSDHEYFVLLVDPNGGETDGLGNIAYRAFLVFDISEKQFKRYGTMEPEVMNFRVIKNTLYVGNHLMESPNGSVTTIDLLTGKTNYIYQLKDGDEFKALETWAPVIALNSDGSIVVQLNEYENKLYRIENDYLIFTQGGSINQLENPNLPIR